MRLVFIVHALLISLGLTAHVMAADATLLKLASRIDQLVDDRLTAEGVKPAAPVNDEEFVRRITLDWLDVYRPWRNWMHIFSRPILNASHSWCNGCLTPQTLRFINAIKSTYFFCNATNSTIVGVNISWKPSRKIVLGINSFAKPCCPKSTRPLTLDRLRF